MSTKMLELLKRNQANMEIRLDEKVTKRKETRALGIRSWRLYLI